MIKNIKKIVWGLLLLLLCIMALYVADQYLYHKSVPEHFNKVSWVGDWHSEKYPMVVGKVLANIPEGVAKNSEFTAEVFIYFHVWSTFSAGKFKLMTLNGWFGEKYFSGNGGKLSETFNAELTIEGEDLIINYSGIKHANGKEISGDYDSKFPLDNGVFKINKKE